jgi:hypothetical protein
MAARVRATRSPELPWPACCCCCCFATSITDTGGLAAGEFPRGDCWCLAGAADAPSSFDSTLLGSSPATTASSSSSTTSSSICPPPKPSSKKSRCGSRACPSSSSSSSSSLPPPTPFFFELSSGAAGAECLSGDGDATDDWVGVGDFMGKSRASGGALAMSERTFSRGGDPGGGSQEVLLDARWYQ